MNARRRTALKLIGAAAIGAFGTGCLSTGAPGGDGRGDGDDPDDGAATAVDPDALPRVDAPPQEITEPACGGGGRDPLWLCENAAAEPSLPFAQAATASRILRGEGLAPEPEAEGDQFYAALLTAADDLERVRPDGDEAAVELIEAADFEAEAVLVVQTGWGSGSITPHLKRIQAVDGGVRAVGCYRRPCGGTADYTTRSVVARFDRPRALDGAHVSLTVDPERRVNFAVGEGVVTVSENR